jgi:hypothetical protein
VSYTANLRSLLLGCRSFDQTFVAGWPISPATRQILFAEVNYDDSLEEEEDDHDEMSSQDNDDDDEMSSR